MWDWEGGWGWGDKNAVMRRCFNHALSIIAAHIQIAPCSCQFMDLICCAGIPHRCLSRLPVSSRQEISRSMGGIEGVRNGRSLVQ